MLGMSRSAVMSLVKAGFVVPSRGPGNSYRFNFQDLVLLRTAQGLRKEHVPQRRIVSALKRLKAELPDALPLTGLRVTAVGDRVAVHEGGARWNAESGQRLLDFEVWLNGGKLLVQETCERAPEVDAEGDARWWFERGETLEAADRQAAEEAYRRSIELAPEQASAYSNLGALLCESGRCGDAVRLLDMAIERCTDHWLLHFNRAIALEDEGRPWDALQAYERSLKLERANADAHFNAARLAEQLGEVQTALRHFNAYRRLSKS